ncbi:MAG: helix-turn-helix domain-containing protein [Nitritalea sp.]
MNTKSWKEIKDEVYGIKGTERRDELERGFESFKIGLLLKKARENKNLTQEQLAELVDKKRAYISRVENNGSNLTLKTLFEIVEKGLGVRSRFRLNFEKGNTHPNITLDTAGGPR